MLKSQKVKKNKQMPENLNIKIHLRITVKRNHIIGKKTNLSAIYQEFYIKSSLFSLRYFVKKKAWERVKEIMLGGRGVIRKDLSVAAAHQEFWEFYAARAVFVHLHKH